MNQITGYLFILALVLIGVAYYAGLSTDATAVGNQVNQLLKTGTGRNSAGNFAAYPGGA